MSLSRGEILKDPVIVSDSTTTGASIKLREGSANGTNDIMLKAPDSLGASYTLHLPPNDGDSGQFLRTDGTGVTTWVTAGLQTPGGVTGDIQYNNAGSYAGLATLNTDGTDVTVSTGNILVEDSSEVRFLENSANGTSYIAFVQPAALAQNNTYTLPDAIGTAGQVLKIATGPTGTTATLEWADDETSTGSASAAGADGAIQLSDGAGGFVTDTLFAYNRTTDVLTVTGSMNAGAVTIDTLTLDGSTISSTGSVVIDAVTSTDISTSSSTPLRLGNSNDSFYISLAAPAGLTGNITYTFPSADGVAGANQVLTSDGSGNLSFIDNKRTINFIIDGGGTSITTGDKGFVMVDIDAEFENGILIHDNGEGGVFQVDVYKSAYNTIPANTDTSIGNLTTGGSAQTSTTDISSWTSITAGDVLLFNVSSNGGSITRTTVALRIRPV